MQQNLKCEERRQMSYGACKEVFLKKNTESIVDNKAIRECPKQCPLRLINTQVCDTD